MITVLVSILIKLNFNLLAWYIYFFFTRMSRHVLLSRLAEHFQDASPGQRFPSPERSVSPRSPVSASSPPHSPDSVTQQRLDMIPLGDIEIAGRALKQYARATGK